MFIIWIKGNIIIFIIVWGLSTQINSRHFTNTIKKTLQMYQHISPIAAYMRQSIGSALVQIMACRIFAPSHYLNQCWVNVNWTIRNKFQWNFNRNSNIFIQGNVLKMSSEKWRPCCPEGDELIMTMFWSNYSLQIYSCNSPDNLFISLLHIVAIWPSLLGCTLVFVWIPVLSRYVSFKIMYLSMMQIACKMLIASVMFL